MVFFTARIISILLLLIAAPYYTYSYFTILLYTFLQFIVCSTSIYGAWISYHLEQKVWTWIFGIVAFAFIILVSHAHLLDLYVFSLTAIVFIISFFFIKKDIKDEKHFVINKAFYPFVILFFVLILFVSGTRYRWERIENLNFSIDNHQYVIEGDYYSYCDDLKDCGWKYYRDRLTGLTKAEQDEYDPILVIYEQPYLQTIDSLVDIFRILLVITTMGFFLYYINLNSNTVEMESNLR